MNLNVFFLRLLYDTQQSLQYSPSTLCIIIVGVYETLGCIAKPLKEHVYAYSGRTKKKKRTVLFTRTRKLIVFFGSNLFECLPDVDVKIRSFHRIRYMIQVVFTDGSDHAITALIDIIRRRQQQRTIQNIYFHFVSLCTR